MVTLFISDLMYKRFELDARYSMLDARRAAGLAVFLPILILLMFSGCSDSKHTEKPEDYTYKIVKTYPHDPNAFTQGLVFEDGFLFEGTGLNGFSSLRKVELETGRILHKHNLTDELFGEGITILKNRIFQLTYKSNVGFVYNKDSFDLLQSFSYPTEGWGITNDGKSLIMSDGSSSLYFLDPETLKQTGSIKVRDNDVPVSGLNELEFIKGKIFANVWPTERIAIIDPQTGQVTGWIYMNGLLNQQELSQPVDVLNGIAYDAAGDRLFVTGKFWPKLYQIKLVPMK